MEYRRLGNTGLEISTIGLGTNNFGRRSDFQESKAVLNQCLESGVNFLDTANAYQQGKSEEFIGEVISKGGHRKDMIIASKVGLPVGGGPPGAVQAAPSKPNNGGGSRLHIMEEVEKSLRRLQTDYIDLYYMHSPTRGTPIDETLRALDDLVHQGKVRYIGASNYAAWQLCEAIYTSKMLNLHAFACIESEYSLLAREPEREIIPFASSYKVGLIPYFPLAAGFLTGKYARGGELPEGTRFSSSSLFSNWFINDRNFDNLDKLKTFAGERGHSTTELAFSWLLQKSVIPSVIAGASTPEQVKANVQAAEWALTADEAAKVTEMLGPITPSLHSF